MDKVQKNEITKLDFVWGHLAKDSGKCEAVGNTLVKFCFP